ncbi:hypothetical protein [Caldiplasma sukawensis]
MPLQNVNLGSLKKIILPFSTLYSDMCDSYSIRKQENRHITVRFSIYDVTVKYFFMDWFFFGFPKNMMRTSTESYGNFQCFEKNVCKINTNYFRGIDYHGAEAACFYIDDLCVEMHGNPENFEKVLNSLNIIRSTNSSFLVKSFYCHAKPESLEWFEEKNIAMLKWIKKTDRQGDLIGDSQGTGKNMMIKIFVNDLKSYFWFMRARKNEESTSIYTFWKKGDIFRENFRLDEWEIYGISRNGPWISLRRNGEWIEYFSSPSGNEKYVTHLIENIHLERNM